MDAQALPHPTMRPARPSLRRRMWWASWRRALAKKPSAPVEKDLLQRLREAGL